MRYFDFVSCHNIRYYRLKFIDGDCTLFFIVRFLFFYYFVVFESTKLRSSIRLSCFRPFLPFQEAPLIVILIFILLSF